MPQSFSSILVHLVSSTKNREPWIRSPIDSQLFTYATTVFKNADCQALAMNGMADHVHTLFRLSRTKTVAEVVKELKTSTSNWIKTKGPDFQGFYWQSGYGALSVSQSNVASVIEYIRNQSEHHRGVSFQDELRALLRKHEIEIDERYALD